MNAILKAPVDLLFFGGIGTYVRASSESDEAVGDRANDAIRVTGADLRCKVIGEGANLGMTQRGRIEAALRRHPAQHRRHRQFGRRQHLRRRGQHQDRAEPPAARRRADARGAQRAARRDDRRGRARWCCATTISRRWRSRSAQRRGLEDLGFQQRLMQTLESAGELDRAVEFLPDEMAIAERRKRNRR